MKIKKKTNCAVAIGAPPPCGLRQNSFRFFVFWYRKCCLVFKFKSDLIIDVFRKY